MLLVLISAFERILLHDKVIEAASERPHVHSCGDLRLAVGLVAFLEEFGGGEGKMTCKILAFEKLNVVVWQSNQIEDWPTFAPMKSCGVNISVHEPVVMHMCHC